MDGINTEVVKILEDQFATQDWEYWERIFKRTTSPYQRLYQAQDILNDEGGLRQRHPEVRPLRCLRREGPCPPLRSASRSMGDPCFRKSRPIGYDTARIMEEYGYTPDESERWMAPRCLLWRRRDARIGVRPQLRAAFEEGLTPCCKSKLLKFRIAKIGSQASKKAPTGMSGPFYFVPIDSPSCRYDILRKMSYISMKQSV